MNQTKNKDSGFSLLELVIAIAVLAFLMTAVSSLIGSSVMQNKKAKKDVRMQSLAQETYSLITDTIMQASDIIIGGFVKVDESAVDFNKPGEESTASCEYYYFVKDEARKEEFIRNCQCTALSKAYGRAEVTAEKSNGVVPTEENVKLFSDPLLQNDDLKNIDPKTKVYVDYIRVESSVPLDVSQVDSTSFVDSSHISNELKYDVSSSAFVTEEYKKKDANDNTYYIHDTLVSTFYFENNNLYYSRKYGFMTKLDDVVDMTNNDSKKDHLYNKYFSYNKLSDASGSSVTIPGCVATVNVKDETIGIDLYYNQSSMKYTTNGRINTRNSYVLKPKQAMKDE